MKHLLLTTIAAAVLVGCGESQQSAPSPETKPDEPVAEAAQPEPPTAKAPDIDIHTAAFDRDIEAVKQHLAAGTDVNAKGRNGSTPLHSAASGGHGGIVELLIAKGADVNANSNYKTPLYPYGKTPLDWANRLSRITAANLLRKYGGKTGEELKAEGK